MQTKNTSETTNTRSRQGQALVEYVLIFVLVVVAFAIALAATGPAIGNVFSNTIYNLLGQTTTPQDLGDANDFWLTVTWVATQTPQEFPLPTKTLPPPSNTPTPGPSPTHTPVTPTNTPKPTNTPGPTNTPSDFVFTAPFSDTIDHPEWWRVDKSIFLGSDDWFGQYYANKTLSGTPNPTAFNGDIDPALKFNLNFDWGNNPPVAGWASGDDFSVKWTRKIYLPVNTTLRFDTMADDGMRVWILGAGQTAGSCSSTGTPSGGPAVGSSVQTYGDPSTDCLLINKWNTGSSNSTVTVTRTIPAGQYTIQVDYFENTGGARARVDITNANAPANVDDTNLTGGAVDCNWGLRPDARDSNTQQFMWEEYVRGDIPVNMRCYLEFRGSVNVPSGMSNAEFTFWDIWDMRSSQTSGWLEIAEYTPVYVSSGGSTIPNPARQAPGYWKRVNLYTGDTTNYNWTRHVIDLSNVGGTDFRGKQITWRFVMENGNSGGSTRRWYVDDIKIDQADYKTFYPGKMWNLDSPDQKADFITTGRWDLTAKNKKGAGGMAWEDSPGGSFAPGDWQNTSYDKHNDWTDRNVRVHSVELKGYVKVNDPVLGVADLEGDTGKPILSFWHAYDMGNKAWLEVQYTTDPYGVAAPNWQPVPAGGGDPPYGEILPYANSTRMNTDMVFVEIPLDQIPATQFRLRFALLVRYDAQLQDGWWIDNIYLERQGKPKFTAYPLFDDAESGTGKWLMGGRWDRTTEAAYPDVGKTHSFTDSPGDNYTVNTNSTMTLLFPFDLNNDTPENPTSTTCNLGAECTPGIQQPAVNPIMTFWHRRALNCCGDGLYIEWRRWDEDDTSANWKPLWANIYRMNTLNSSNSTRARIQLAWERVEVDLRPIIESFDPNASILTDDDIIIRFRLYSDSGSTEDGIYLDNIQIGERVEKSWKLWSTGDQSGGFGFGNGASILEDIDVPFDWWNRWWNGGNWEVIDWERKSGLKSFHDSARAGADVQAEAPPDVPVVVQQHSTFNVLEMQTIIDLRAVDVSTGPTLYFWSRYQTGDRDYLRVEIAVENTSLTSPCGTAGLDQCYEHLRGWTEWEEVWRVDPWRINYTWTREQIPLDRFAVNGVPGQPGKRIKIRFVSDSLENNNNRDGWYIDDVTIKYRNPPKLYQLPFSDPARNLSNWIPEGKWGLSPEFFRGSGGGPASLGATWNGYWWNCSACSGPSGANSFLNARPNNENPNATETVLDINHDVGGGNLFCEPAPSTTCYSNRVAGRWVLTTPMVGSGLLQPGDYTFITISDDGVRLKYEDITPPNSLPPTPEWNVISNWSNHGRVVDIGTAKLDGGNQYKFTLEYYENGSSAVIILTLGSNSFSFTDSPKQGAGPAFPDVPAVKRGNSSLLLNGLLDLSGHSTVLMEYYTYHELGGTARVEISPDGGFCWAEECVSNYRSKLRADIMGAAADDPFYGGTYTPDDGDWRRKTHNLSSFAGPTSPPVGLRFRLDRTGTDDIDVSCNCSNGGSTNWYVSWWIVDIQILEP